MGRPVSEIVSVYTRESKKKLCDCQLQQKSDNVYVSLVSGLTLTEYVIARGEYCKLNHSQPCVCQRFLQVGQFIIDHGLCSLSTAFNITSPSVQYTSERARRKLLQMPLVAILIGDPKLGLSSYVLMEHIPSFDYTKLAVVMERIIKDHSKRQPHVLDRDYVKLLLGMAQSYRERECLRHAIVTASGLTPTAARNIYGFENTSQCSVNVDNAINKMQEIRETIDEMAVTREKAVLDCFCVDESDTSSCDESNDEFTGNEIVHAPAEFEITVDELKDILELCEYNWFGILDIYESKQTECEINALSDRLFALIDNIDLSDHAIKLIKQSKLAYDSALRDAQEDDRITKQVNEWYNSNGF